MLLIAAFSLPETSLNLDGLKSNFKFDIPVAGGQIPEKAEPRLLFRQVILVFGCGASKRQTKAEEKLCNFDRFQLGFVNQGERGARKIWKNPAFQIDFAMADSPLLSTEFKIAFLQV